MTTDGKEAWDQLCADGKERKEIFAETIVEIFVEAVAEAFGGTRGCTDGPARRNTLARVSSGAREGGERGEGKGGKSERYRPRIALAWKKARNRRRGSDVSSRGRSFRSRSIVAATSAELRAPGVEQRRSVTFRSVSFR